MNFIWETVNKYVPENMADGVFLTTLIVGWCVLVFGVGMLFCVMAAGSASAGCIVNVMCMALYAAIIFGLFGGIFYLFRHHRPGSWKRKIDFVLEILQELGNIPEAFQTRIQPEKDLQALTKVNKN